MTEGILSALPGGAVLAQGESIRSSAGLLVSNVWLYLKLQVAVTNKRLVGERPNTLLGFIPVGTQKISYPLNNIAGVQTSTRIAVLPLLLGLLFLLAGLASLKDGGLWAVLIGALLLVYCYQAQLTVQNSGGGTIHHRISVFNKTAAQDFAQQVNTIIAERT